MNKIKHLLTATVILLVIVTGLLGIFVVLDLASFEQTKESLIKLLQIFGIVTAVTAIIVGILHLNKHHEY